MKAKLDKKGEKVDSTAVGDCIAKFMILVCIEIIRLLIVESRTFRCELSICFSIFELSP